MPPPQPAPELSARTAERVERSRGRCCTPVPRRCLTCAAASPWTDGVSRIGLLVASFGTSIHAITGAASQSPIHRAAMNPCLLENGHSGFSFIDLLTHIPGFAAHLLIEEGLSLYVPFLVWPLAGSMFTFLTHVRSSPQEEKHFDSFRIGTFIPLTITRCQITGHHSPLTRSFIQFGILPVKMPDILQSLCC
jgi:hypothetical protein